MTSLRTVHIGGEAWRYRIGGSHAEIFRPDADLRGERIKANFADIKNLDWNSIEKGQRKGTRDGMVTPGDMKWYIERSILNLPIPDYKKDLPYRVPDAVRSIINNIETLMPSNHPMLAAMACFLDFMPNILYEEFENAYKRNEALRVKLNAEGGKTHLYQFLRERVAYRLWGFLPEIARYITTIETTISKETRYMQDAIKGAENASVSMSSTR